MATIDKRPRPVACCCFTFSVCVQCMIGAATAGAAATGIRSVAAVKLSRFMTPLRMRMMTGSLIATAFVLASTALSAA